MTSITVLGQLAIYGVLFIARMAGFGFHASVLGRPVSGGQVELQRVGSDLALMGMSIFLGAAATRESAFHTHSAARYGVTYTECLAAFLLLALINYTLFLFLKGDDLGAILRNRGTLWAFVISLFIGWLGLWAATLLATAPTA